MLVNGKLTCEQCAFAIHRTAIPSSRAIGSIVASANLVSAADRIDNTDSAYGSFGSQHTAQHGQ